MPTKNPYDVPLTRQDLLDALNECFVHLVPADPNGRGVRAIPLRIEAGLKQRWAPAPPPASPPSDPCKDGTCGCPNGYHL